MVDWRKICSWPKFLGSMGGILLLFGIVAKVSANDDGLVISKYGGKVKDHSDFFGNMLIPCGVVLIVGSIGIACFTKYKRRRGKFINRFPTISPQQQLLNPIEPSGNIPYELYPGGKTANYPSPGGQPTDSPPPDGQPTGYPSAGGQPTPCSLLTTPCGRVSPTASGQVPPSSGTEYEAPPSDVPDYKPCH